ncbi:RNA-directed DNA polymerase from mobile element jockey [Termitomyces sp. J132]|nr:RNA-directed DNA polymerase from mobile element jockey [Termitomyces sp. J132]
MYIDDGTIKVSSSSLDINVQILKREFTFINGWLTRVGLLTAPEKTELMHYSWRQDRGYLPTIDLPMPDGTTTVIKAAESIRILGLHLDRKLTFNQHVQKITQKAKNAVAGTWILANTIRGLGQIQLRTLYRACVIPIMTYACPVWWTGKKTHVEKLTKVQNKALRHMAGAF